MEQKSKEVEKEKDMEVEGEMERVMGLNISCQRGQSGRLKKRR